MRLFGGETDVLSRVPGGGGSVGGPRGEPDTRPENVCEHMSYVEEPM